MELPRPRSRFEMERCAHRMQPYYIAQLALSPPQGAVAATSPMRASSKLASDIFG